MDNQTIAKKLKTYARQLERDQANLYRIKAYRRAAESIERLAIPVADLVAAKGVDGLRQLPGVGDHLSFAIERLIATGDYHTLTETHQETPRADDIRALQGVGPHLAELLWEKLGIRSVAELETAIRENRLEALHLGNRRCQNLRNAVEQYREETRHAPGFGDEPSVAELLELDRDYRRLAEQDQLPTIAPEKFNPFKEAWLPLYAVRRGGWKYRVLFANTALAHRLCRTRDWVVIYFSNDAHRGQRTVVTETRSTRRGRRVVRGREAECERTAS